MVHLQSFLSLNSSSHLPYPLPTPVSLIAGNYTTTTKLGCGYGLDFSVSRRKGGRNFHFQINKASERESDPFEIDQAKAHDALKMFDEQLKSYSNQQIRSPKIKASDMESIAGRDQVTTDPTVDDILSGPFLGNLTFALLLFTIFYNIFYFKVLEPTSVRKAPAETEVSERIPLMEF